MRAISIVFFLCLLAPLLSAQITPVSIEERVAEATLIVEAEVLDAQSFWDSRRQNIYTSHRLRVFKVFKGDVRTAEFEILTLGGVVGTQGQHTSHVLRLGTGDIGLFLCTPTAVGGSPRGFPSDARMQAVAAEQGFLRYSEAEQIATDPFVDYGDIEAALYPLIVSLTGRPWTEKAERGLPPSGGSFHKGGGGHEVTALGITSMTGPHPAGNHSLLTITGTDFGNTTGKVRFVSADNNSNHYFDALPAEIVSWSSTQIEVYVPPGAGTGKVRIVKSAPVDSVDSASDLTVPYSRLAATYNNDHWTTDHVDMNGNGGYTWQMNTTFAGTAARKTAFLDQLELWRCATTTNRVNWDIGRDTALAVIAADGVNLALMGGLPSGVLGRCTSRWYISTCSPNTIVWLYELDIAFSTGFTWEYTGTPASGVYDFRSVALHELGHGMQIGHAKNSAQVMYYAIGSGSMKRTLHTNDVAAGQDAMDASVASNPCGGPPITAQSANAGPDRNICAGSSVTLTAQGGTAYEWTIPSSSTVLSTAPSYTVSPATTTTYRVSVTSGSCVSASTDDVTVTVRAMPLADAGSDVGICPSGSAAIGSAGVSATNYTSTGSGSTTANNIMFTTGYEDNRTQLLFTVAELNALGFSAGIITDLAFSIAGSSTASQAMNNFNVRIAHTNATDLSTGFRSETFTTVYSSAAFTPSGTGWQNLDLIPWFRWNGLENVLVEVCFDNSSSTTSYDLNCTTHGSYLCAYSRGTGSGCSLGSQFVNTARPQTRFTIASEGYSWSPTAGLTSPYVANPTASPATTTTYTLTVTSQYGCEDSDQVTVTVHPTDPGSLTWTGAVNTDWSTTGNWDNPCAIPTSGDAVTIPTGTTPPTGVPALTLGSLALDNSSGVTLGNAMTVSGTLALTNGNITLGNNDLTIGASGSISGGSGGSHVVTNGTGMLIQQNIGSGGRSGSVLFPIATTTTYTPMTLLNAGTADIFRVRVTEGVLDGGTTGTPLAAHAVAKTWIIEEASAGGSDATVTLQWNSGDELSLFDRSNSFVAKHNGTSWTPLQSAAAASGSNPYTRSVPGVTSFSPFGIGDGASALPVELTSFHAALAEGKVKLSWTTATEVNNYGFTVERRIADESPWQDIGFVPGAGTRNTPTTYAHMDNRIPETSIWMYRLRQRDRDGTEHVGPEVTVLRSLPDAFSLSAPWPQPSSEAVNIRVAVAEEAPLTLRIHDLRGAVVRTLHDARVSRGMHVFRTGTKDLRSGSYVIVATTPEGVRRVRLVVLR